MFIANGQWMLYLSRAVPTNQETFVYSTIGPLCAVLGLILKLK